ncbi:MAG TPA: lysine--tRNA ligase [Gammaproteobacteria bacterium]|nr:lysine--tRNA ligase [Gammaproteobacteria bacterium]
MSEINEQVEVIDEHDQIGQRKLKLDEWRKSTQAYPNDFKRKDLAQNLIAQFDAHDHDQLEKLNHPVTVAGRIMLRRLMGKASFCHIQDMSGRIQIYVRENDLPEGAYELFKNWDTGDIIGVEGVLFKTKTNELSIKASTIRLLSKALRPLPDKFHGLADQELRYRQRYVDLIVTEKTRKTFEIRAKTVEFIREFLKKENYLEVETPMMQVIPGGAAAKPFVTHHNALDMDLYLRIAPELYLKRLVVGGFERVFEINRNFRNEGLSTRHNPEFTMVEFYQAYATYEDLIILTEKLMRELVQAVLGNTIVEYQGEKFDFGKKFDRLTVIEAILKYNPEFKKEELSDMAKIKKLAQQLKIDIHDNYGLGKIQIEIFEKTVETKLIQPTFITQYPAEVSPLARRNDNDPFVTDRFEFFIGGREIANAFSELNDPEDQAQRFLDQVKQKEAGDQEAMHYDADYINALEYGMPPTAGEGIGIDRLVMLLTDNPSIRDVILFPHMRPKD